MTIIVSLGNKLIDLLDKFKHFNFFGPLALRLYLAPIFIMAGWNKLEDLESTAYYFGEFLGMPMPMLMAFLAGATEFIGGIALLFGIAVRLLAVPLMFTMLIAATTAHWENGWHALPETTLTVPWEWRTDLIEEAQTRKQAAQSLLQRHGNYNWLTEAGPITILKNGIEFAATYFIMLLVLFFIGGGKYVSLDYWLAKRFRTS